MAEEKLISKLPKELLSKLEVCFWWWCGVVVSYVGCGVLMLRCCRSMWVDVLMC